MANRNRRTRERENKKQKREQERGGQPSPYNNMIVKQSSKLLTLRLHESELDKL
jgi:hypothetical protein